jgi:hypothetical protein
MGRISPDGTNKADQRSQELLWVAQAQNFTLPVALPGLSAGGSRVVIDNRPATEQMRQSDFQRRTCNTTQPPWTNDPLGYLPLISLSPNLDSL